MITRIKAHLPVLLAIFFIIIASVLFLWSTEQGIGIRGDSTIYLSTAVNLLNGNGFVFNGEPMTAYAPLYPAVLAFTGLFNPDLLAAARWLHLILYVVNLLLFAGIFYTLTNRNLLAGGLASIIFITSKTVIYVHTITWSEPLFIMLMFSACLLLARYFVTQKWKFLLFGSILCGLAVLTRYAGLALIPAVALGILILSAQPLRKRFVALMAFCSIAILPMAVWAIRNMLITQNGQQAARALIFHPRSITTLGRELTSLFYMFIFPGEGSKYWMAAVIVLLTLCLFVLLGILWKNRRFYLDSHRYETSILGLTVLMLVSFLVTVFGSITFVDAAIPITERIFIPAMLLIIISAFSAIFMLSWLKKGEWLYWASIVLMVLFFHFNIADTRAFTKIIHREGIGFNSIPWKNSETISSMTELDAGQVIYSNSADILIALTGRPVIVPFPLKYTPRYGLENSHYQQEMMDMCDNVKNGDAIIVYMTDIERAYFTGYEELVNTCQFPSRVEFSDGVIFGNITADS